MYQNKLKFIKNSFINIYLYLLFIVYLIASVFLNDSIQFVMIGVLLIISFFLVSLTTKLYVIHEHIYVFLTILFITILVSFPHWKTPFDWKDIVALFLYFGVIPTVISSLNNNFSDTQIIFINSVKIFFLIFVTFILLYGCFYGIDFNRSNLLNFGIKNKNGFSFIFEILFIFTLYSSNKNKNSIFIITQIFLGFICSLIIGSKTSIFLIFIFSFIYYFHYLLRPLFVTTLLGMISFYLLYQYGCFIALKTAFSRFLLWNEALNEIFNNYNTFLWGNGPGTFKSKLHFIDLYEISSPHNYLIHIFHSYGIIVLSLLLFYFKRTFNLLKKNPPFYYSFMIYFIHSFFDVGFVKGPGFVAALIIGFIQIRTSNHK
jgi:hypothetical protein